MTTEMQPAGPDQSWTLFLDRDGVINVETVGSYVTTWEEFVFCTGVREAWEILSHMFGRILVVTNQRGVGRGIMSFETLRDIHSRMSTAIAECGGRLDGIYACTAVGDEDENRKPNTGMAMQAKEDFPEIDFRKSIMVGNSLSDMSFGKRLAMRTVFLTTKHEPYPLPHELIDEQFASLADWARSLSPATLSQQGQES